MKILFLIRSLGRGGAERQLTILASGLAEKGHDVSIAVFYKGDELEKDLDDTGVRIIDLEKKSRWDVLGFFKRLKLLVKKEQPDIVHSYLGTPNILAAILSKACKGPTYVWGIRASFMDNSQYDWLTRVESRLEAKLSKMPHAIIVNSRAGQEFCVRRGFPLKKMKVVQNGIDVDKFRPHTRRDRTLRVEWGCKPGERLIGIVARIDPMKDHSAFIEAASLLASKTRKVRFAIIGPSPDKEYTKRLKKMAKRLDVDDRIFWVGPRDDMPRVYSALDICCLSSIGEGFPNVLAEAMSCGTTCVATKVGDSIDIIGDTGELCPPRDGEALAMALARMIRRLEDVDPIEQMKDCRRRIITHFSKQAMIQKTEDLLKEIAP